MALVKFGNGVAAISGKIDGTVFSRVRGGAIARGWTKPTSQPTPIQTAYRSNFGISSFGWNGLTGLQRDGWNGAATLLTRKNRLGEDYVPTGRQLFMESAQNMQLIGQTPLVAVPDDFAAPQPVGSAEIVASVAGGGIDVLTVEPNLSDSEEILVFATPPAVSQAKNNLTNEFRLIQPITAGITGVSILTAYTALFGDIAAVGQPITLKLATVSPLNGMRSTELIVKGSFVSSE